MKRTIALTKMLVAGLVLLLGLGLQLGVAQASPAADPGVTVDTVEVLSYAASGYRYLEFGTSAPATPPTDFDEPGFDDSAFSTGAAGFGLASNQGGCGNPPITAWSQNSNLVLRKEITVPAEATDLRIMIAIDNDIVGVFFNGTLLSAQYPLMHDGCAHRDSFRLDVPQSLVLTGQNLVAFHVLDRGGQTFFDNRILAEVSLDSDGDGVNDDVDLFVNSNTDPTVAIDGCNSGVTNVQVGGGANMNDLIGAITAKNHGAYVSKVSKLADQWKKAGLISGRDKGKITSCAARSDLP